jgi:hypothetical protein
MLKWILVAATIAAAAPAAAAGTDPLTFFTGRTHGDGKLKIIMKAPVSLSIDTRGKPDGHGGIVLDQIIREGTKPLRSRRWILRPTSATTLLGTLTDAASPVRGSISGRVLKLNYVREDGLHASHVLTLQPGGRTMTNRTTVKRLGLVVARVEEVIRKLD